MLLMQHRGRRCHGLTRSTRHELVIARKDRIKRRHDQQCQQRPQRHATHNYPANLRVRLGTSTV